MTFLHKEKLKKLREETEKKYIMIKSVKCPALRADVVFSSNGLHHLRYDGNRKERNKKSQYAKFKYFPVAVDIIKKSMTIQEYRRSLCPVGSKDKGGMRKTSTIEWFGFFAVTSFSEKIRLKVIVRRIGGEDGEFHFWSVIPYWSISNNQRIIASKDLKDD